MKLQELNINKVLLVIPTDEIGGAEQLIKQLAINYQSKGKNVKVICLTRKTIKNGWSDYPGEVKYINSSNVFIGVGFLILFLFNKSYDLVISSQVYVNGILGFLRKYKWCKFSKLVVRESTSIFLRFKGFRLWTYKILYNIGYKKIDLVICQTELMKEQLINNFTDLEVNKVVVIDNPINLEDILSKSKRDLEYGEIDDNTIVALGRMMPSKGFDILIHSFKNVLAKNPELKLLILGDGDDRNNLNSIIKLLQLEEKVFMPGYSQNPFPYLKKARICVISSLIEGFPNILLQMMTLNNHVVSTKCAGGIENIKGIHTAEINNISSLTNAISEAINEQREDSQNRQLFDIYLKERSVENFLYKMENKIF